MKMLRFLMIFMGVINVAFAQNGHLEGTVLEKVNNEPIPFANVVVMNTQSGASTDFDGKYSISVPAGTYTVEFSFIGYEPVKREGVKIAAGKTTVLDQSMGVSSSQLAEVEIVSKADRESQATLLLDRKEATSLVQNIGAAKLKKTASSDVASGVAKVVGVSVMSGGNLFVRGLGDRYNSAYLNNLPIASPDPDLKVIPLNIFPSSIVRNLTVQKSYSPELFGDFSGGAINISTKDYPDEKTLEISVGAGYNTQSTFKSANTYEGASTDYFGIDNGSRNRPEAVVMEDERFYSSSPGEGNPFAHNLNMKQSTAPLNSSFSLLYGDNKKSAKGGGRGLGYIFLLSHSNSHEYQEGQYRIINAQDEYRINYRFNNSVASTNSSAMAALNYRFSHDHSISYNGLFVNLSSDQTRETFGSHFDYASDIYTTRFTYKQNSLISNQLSGKHKFLNDDRLQLNWWMSSNNAFYKEPDRRQLVWFYDPAAGAEGNLTINNQDVNDNHRFFSELDENEVNAKLEAEYVLSYSNRAENKKRLELILGGDYKNKHRTFDYWQYNFIIPGGFSGGMDINNPDGSFNDENLNNGTYRIEQKIDPSSFYEANLGIMAGYAKLNYTVNPLLKIIAGLRAESGLQTIDYKEQNIGKERRETINSVDLLPVLSAIYNLNEKNGLRFSASKTISRPGFREVAPFQYIDFFAGKQTQGNPELINGTNYNADLRYENYPNTGEIFSVSAFAKYLQDPIERVLVATPSGQLESFVNTGHGIAAGVELELLKDLSTCFDAPVISDIDLGFNATYIFTEVVIDTETKVLGASIIPTNERRPLQGASPYLINFDINYQKAVGKTSMFTTSLSYNVFGKRLYAAGGQGVGDVYEQPRNTLNLVLSLKTGKHWGMSFKARNILNASVVHVQDAALADTSTDLITNSFTRGAQYGISISYNLF